MITVSIGCVVRCHISLLCNPMAVICIRVVRHCSFILFTLPIISLYIDSFCLHLISLPLCSILCRNPYTLHPFKFRYSGMRMHSNNQGLITSIFFKCLFEHLVSYSLSSTD